MTEQTEIVDRYLESDGRAYRYDGEHLYRLLAHGDERRMVVSGEIERILSTGVDFPRARAIRLAGIVADELKARGVEER